MDKEQFLKEAEGLSLSEVKHLVSRLLSIKDKKVLEERAIEREKARNNIQPLLKDLEWEVKFDRRGDCRIVAGIHDINDQNRIQHMKEVLGLYTCSWVALPDYESCINGVPMVVKGPKLCLNDDDGGVNLWFTTPKLAYDYVKLMGLQVQVDVSAIQQQLQPLQKMLDLSVAWINGKDL